MSIEHCHQCDRDVDTDYDSEHFDEEYNGCRDTYQFSRSTLYGLLRGMWQSTATAKATQNKELRVWVIS